MHGGKGEVGAASSVYELDFCFCPVQSLCQRHQVQGGAVRGGHGASKLVRLRRAASVARVRVGWEAGAGRRALLRCYGEGAFSSGGGKVRRRRAEAPFLAWRLNVVA